MCDKVEQHTDCDDSRRRNFLKTTSAAAALGLIGGALFTRSARADALTKAQRDKMTPEQVIEAMKAGNERFQRGERKSQLP